MQRKLCLGAGVVASVLSLTSASVHAQSWSGPPKLPPVPTTELRCPAGARVLLRIEDTQGPLTVHVDKYYAFIVSPFGKQPPSPDIITASPRGWTGARPPATMDLTPLVGPDTRVHVSTILNYQPSGGAKLLGDLRCDRAQATITGEDGGYDGNQYKHVYVLKRD